MNRCGNWNPADRSCLAGTIRRYYDNPWLDTCRNCPLAEDFLYCEISGREVPATYQGWREEWIRGINDRSIPYALERMLEYVTENTYCEALDGKKEEPTRRKPGMHALPLLRVVFLMWVAVMVLIATGIIR